MKPTVSAPHGANDTGRASARLVAALRQNIRTGAVSAGDFLPPVRALGAQHRMAVATVCKGLRQLAQEGLVAAVPRRGYRILPQAAEPTGSLACVVSAERITAGWEPFFAAIETAVKRAAGRRGWPTAWMPIAHGKEESLKGQLQAVGAWGMVLDSIDPAMLAVARRAGVSVVMVDAWKHGEPFDAVVQDNFCGAELATRHLLDRGHRTFGWLGPVRQTHHSRERFGGAVATLATAGLAFVRQAEVDTDGPEVVAQAAAFLTGPKRPTAILALWPSMAVALAKAAREARLVAGRDFEMVGWCAEEIYDSTFLPAMGGVPLAATVVWSADAMAEVAIRRLIEQRHDPARPPLRLNIATRLRLPAKRATHR